MTSPEERDRERAQPSPPAKMSINDADRDDLVGVDGIGQIIAEAILDYREDVGPFRDIEELRKIPQIDEEHLEILGRHFMA